MKQVELHIGDVAVALAMGIAPRSKLKTLSEMSCRSIGEVHNAERRLRLARLLRPAERAIELEPLIRFIRWGVPHAYPATTGPLSVGVATARMPSGSEPAEAEFVWPDPAGTTRGQAMEPPFKAATQLLARSPALRDLLSLLDLVRVGGTREQNAAADEIARRLSSVSG